MSTQADTYLKQRRRGTLGVASLAHVLHDGFSASIYLLLPIWQAEFGLTLGQVGFLKAAYTAGMASFQVPAGLLAERCGERALLVLGTALAGVAYWVLGAQAGGFAFLIVCLFVVGAGGSTQHPLSSSLVAHAYEGGARRTALGIYNFAGDIGKLAFPAGTALLLAIWPWRWVTASYAGIAITIALIIFAVLGMLGMTHTHPRSRQHPAASAWSLRGADWGIRDRQGFRALSAIYMIDDSTRTAFLTFMPFLLTAKGATVPTIGLALTLVFAGGAVGKFLCGILAERIGIIRTVVVTELVTGAGILLLIAVPLGWALVMMPLIGVALNGTSSVLYGTVAEFVAPERRARAFGLFYTLGSCAGAAAPAIYGIVSDFAGVPVTFVIVGTAVLTTIPLAQVLRRCLAREHGLALP